MSFTVENISYKYSAESKEVLKNVSFKIKEAEVTAIVGPSGSGKSTLVNILSGIIPTLISEGIYEGSFDVDKDISISVISQTPENQLFGYGVEDAISFGIENIGLDNNELNERMEYVLDLLNLQYLRKRSVATLSGGQRQAVCIASVLAMRPDILVMDEPVSSLDPNGKRMIQSVLNMLRATGQTTVIVDNNLNWFSGIVDHVLGLYDGEVVFDGKKEIFFSDFEIQKKLGVTIPQAAEIYRELSKKVSGMDMFYNVEDAKKEISKIMMPLAPCQYDKEDIVKYPEEFLCVKGLSKTFNDGFRALININTCFEPGKVVSILGQNGSGKTTLVKHLNGLLRPSEGAVEYKGKTTSEKSVAQISKNIILVFQHPEHMIFEETVYQELTFCARAQGVDFTEEEALKVLESYQLLEQKDDLPINLSMGKKHLLTILSVLFSSADVVILDEPTLGMDLHLKNELENIIQLLKDSGKTVIIISHEIPLVFKITDDIIILNDGEKLAQDSKFNIAIDSEILESTNINPPAVVVLSKYFNLPKICFDVDSFVEEFSKQLNQN